MKLNSNELMKQRTPIKHLLSPDNNLTTAVVAGWVKSYRDSKSVGFLMLNDGSCQQDLQVVVAKELLTPELSAQLLTGASFLAQGTWVTSVGQKQQGELQASELFLVGAVDPSYPLQKKATSLEFLREQAHLRGRTNTIAAVLRVRHLLSMATHQFFDQKGYYYVHTPIISSSDCEGAGEMFRVTTLDPVALAKEKKPVQWDQDYFAQATYLAVSGQLQGEALAMGLGGIYTFGPTFRSENSHTSRHLSEFWMIEPEVAFCQLGELATLATEYLCYCLKEVLQKAPAELQFFEQHYQPQLRANLEQVVQGKFLRITYTEAVEILLASKKQFTYPVSWGADLQSEHERYLTDEHFKSPVIVTHYPKELKSFYMRLEDDGKTVRAMDVLVPGIGEVIGGSEREERYDVLLERMKEKGLSQAEYQWYLDLRRFGGVPHAGFGLGLERLVMYATGISNIRDVIPFPRFPQSAKF